MVGPQVKRQAVDVLREERGFGITRACGLLMISRSLYGYRSRRPVTVGLRERICQLAGEKRRYGYRRIHVLLRCGERVGESTANAPIGSTAMQDSQFAGVTLRFPKDLQGAMEPSRFLVPRRAEDVGNDLWRTFNVLQENLLRGGILRRTASNRLRRTRGVTAIQEDVRLNSALWGLALARAA